MRLQHAGISKSFIVLDMKLHTTSISLAERANSGLHGHVLDKILELVTDRAAPILDLGCGTGALLAQLRQRGYKDLTGLDIASPAPAEGVRFVEADLDDCRSTLPDASIRLVVAVEVIEHVENIGSLLAELSRVLAPDGQILMTTPNVHSLQARIRYLFNAQLKQFDRLGDPTHVYPVFQFPFRRILGRHGLQIIQSWGFPIGGSSPTSRPSLQALAALAGVLGLRGAPAGDQLCLVLARTADAANERTQTKQELVTAHYGRLPAAANSTTGQPG